MKTKYILPIIAAACLLFFGCGHNHEEHDTHDHEPHAHQENVKASEDHEDEHAHEEHGSDEIILPPAKAEAAGVKVEQIKRAPFAGVLRTGGRIISASGEEKTVVAPVAGIVKMRRSLTEGQQVGKGEALFTVTSSSLPEGDFSTRNKIVYENAKAEFERAEALKADRLITDKEYLAAKAEYERARLAYEAVGGAGSAGGVTVSSPMTGYITEIPVTDGAYVETGTPLLMLSQNRTLHLRAEVPERDFMKAREAVSAKFRTAYSDRVYDLAPLNGRKIADVSAGNSKGGFLPVTFEFNNPGGLVSGSYAEIYLITDSRHDAIAVPAGALTEEQGVKYVYVRLDEEGYSKREVKTGASDGERVEILSGLREGEDVVTEGAIHVKLASATAAIPAHTHNH